MKVLQTHKIIDILVSDLKPNTYGAIVFSYADKDSTLNEHMFSAVALVDEVDSDPLLLMKIKRENPDYYSDIHRLAELQNEEDAILIRIIHD